MPTKKKQVKQSRNGYSDEYRAEALKLADRVGVSAAAEQLGLYGSQIYGWRSKARRQETQSDSEKRILAENARLKRQLSEQEEELQILKKASAYFARNQK